MAHFEVSAPVHSRAEALLEQGLQLHNCQPVGRYAEAAQIFEQAAAHATDPVLQGVAWCNAASALTKALLHSKALEAIENALRVEPSHPRAVIKKHELLLALNQPIAASRWAEDSARYLPEEWAIALKENTQQLIQANALRSQVEEARPKGPGQYTGPEAHGWLPTVNRLGILMSGAFVTANPTPPTNDHLLMPYAEWAALSIEQRNRGNPSAQRVPIQSMPNIWTRSPIWIYVHQGSMVEVECDAIVNAANSGCMGGGAIDGAVHKAAGRDLVRECSTFNGCQEGHARITKGYLLPAKFVIHTVGPSDKDPGKLRNCYWNALNLAAANGLASVAFCGISTGMYGFDMNTAAEIATKTVMEWATNTSQRSIQAVAFCCFKPEEFTAYHMALNTHVPRV